MYKAGPGSLAGQGRELEGEKCKETEREKKIVMYGRTDQGGNELEREVCVCVSV